MPGEGGGADVSGVPLLTREMAKSILIDLPMYAISGDQEDAVKEIADGLATVIATKKPPG